MTTSMRSRRYSGFSPAIALLAIAVAAFFGLGMLISEGSPPTGTPFLLVVVPLALATIPPFLLPFLWIFR